MAASRTTPQKLTEDARTTRRLNRRPFAVWARDLGWRHVVGVLGAVFAMFPIIWIISASINPLDSLSANSSIIPEGATLESYRELFDDETLKFSTWIWNSVKIALIAATLQLFMSAMAAFSFSRLRWKGRRTGLLVILLLQMFPQFLAFIALFLFLDQLDEITGGGVKGPRGLVWIGFGIVLAVAGWFIVRRTLRGGMARISGYGMITLGLLLFVLALMDPSKSTVFIPGVGLNTHTGIILVYLGGAIGVNTWLIKGFMDSIPFSLDESARVDGASQWDTFSRIILPLSRPVLAVIFVITFVALYNEYILASLLLTDADQTTFAVGLQLFSTGQYSAKWGQMAAAGVLGGFPILVVMLAAQKNIVGGLTAGSVKG
ncbi:MAG: sugar ABC transporter permease [Acidimicrobiia bacterium]|nr:sugar ABC transporter permease [Acidimicrobiia bacterium]